ncbi:MAG: ABC transporter ATP-binding protein [Rhodospirillales bacterium]|jgi:branched-chain amino acid transport system ATP-binding protein
MLQINNIEVMYNNVVLVLRGISLEAKEGKITTVLGANGAGKTTTLKAISGLLRPERGDITKGNITFGGERIDHLAGFEIVKKGVVQVFEGRRVFVNLTVDENLIAGGHIEPSTAEMNRRKEMVYTYFPRIKERHTSRAGYLSGGEQQMLAIGRALMSNPKMVCLDEPSLGLAPMIVEEIFGIIKRLNEEQGVTILLVEQNAALALEYADFGYVMENGSIVMEGEAESLKTNSDIQEFYLGMSEGGERKSYRDVKTYRRRKRWLS